MQLRQFLIALLTVPALAGLSQAQLTFLPGTSFSTGASPTGLATADLNGDGLDDIATTSHLPDQVEIYFGTGAGFVLAQIIPFPGEGPSSLVALDAENDGDMDLVVTLSDDLPNAVQLLSNVAGTFSPVGPKTDVGGIEPMHIAAGDFNNDGVVDVITTNAGDDTVSVLFGTGSGFVFGTVRTTLQGVTHVATGDFDLDGLLDAVVTCSEYGALFVYYNAGAGDLDFRYQQLSVSSLTAPGGVAVGDFDGDGDLDIAGSFSVPNPLTILHFAVGYENHLGLVSTGVLFGPSLLEFSDGKIGAGMASADFDGDGNSDMAIANQFSDTVSVIRSCPIAPANLDFDDDALVLTADLTPDDLITGDFDGDGLPDLAVLNLGSDNITVFLNRTPQPPRGFIDLCNGDGGDGLGCTDCPCGNNATAGTIGGCLNSAGSSSRLRASGDPSVSLPPGSLTDLRFSLTGAPASTLCVLNSGNGVAPGNMSNPCFGMSSGLQSQSFDGLRCAIQNTRRHGGRAADVNGEVGITTNPWGGEGAPPAGIANVGAGFSAGQTRFFQVIHRDNPIAVCARGLNTSQAVSLTFEP